ncbi:hypothetical protein SAMN06296241_1232 [Salinimicrobium sediminis]|uniref:Uncharacterized protein n=1 Tax=Salinimicrobium sediminis TaxID=1343891 RepID=A0A285X2V8_9FLAO|nr:hypothetical protein [Salinimicrobium sediminis]SOC79700.1 hypothetical protein SAMN06296241_1232 [Salinimicrobium sediminis]
MRKILVVFLMLSLLSCEDEAEKPVVAPLETSTSFSDSLKISKTRNVILSPEAREIAADWLAYITAQNEIENLENKTGSEIVESSNNLMQIMESLRETLPDTLKTNAVEARTNVLLTKAHVLHQFSNKKQKNPDEIFEVAQNLVVEFDNFKLQLNELFLKTPENFELELDQEFEESLEADSTGTIPLFREREI